MGDHAEVKSELEQACEAVRRIQDKVVERVVGAEVRDGLRDAARHFLKAGLAALDAEERRTKKTAESPKA